MPKEPESEQVAREREVRSTWLRRPLVAQLLRRVILILVSGTALMSAILLLMGRFHTARLFAITGVFSAILWLLQNRGHVKVASVAISVGLIGVAGYAMATGSGINDSSIVMIPGIFLLVSLLLGTTWLLIIALVASFLIAFVAYLEIDKNIVEPSLRLLAWTELFEVLAVVWIVAAMIFFTAQTLARAFQDEKWARDSARALFNGTDDAIMVHDAKSGRIIDVNEAMLRMYGCTLAEAKCVSPEDLSSGESPYDAEHAIEHLKKAINEGPQAFSWHARRSNGQLFWVEVSLRFEEVMGTARVLAVVRDVSERREIDQRIHNAERMSAVGLLAGGVAHDFNNQLVGIMGNAEFLRDESKDPVLVKSAEAVLQSSERAAELTRKLLAFARQGRDQAEAVNLHELVAEVSALVGRSIDKRISIDQKLEAERMVVIGDSSALQNALLNLTINARDAMPNGGHLLFQTRVLPAGILVDKPEVECISLSVSDDGEGMSDEVKKRVFEPFFTTKAMGSGMGLAAVYGTVREHGGEIELESSLGRGSRFEVILPLSDQTAFRSLHEATNMDVSGEGRVLVVDDEKTVSNVVRAALSKAGYQVDVFESGALALDDFEEGKYSLAVLDITMPEMDGVELLTQLRKQDPKIPAFFVSGHASELLQERLRSFDGIQVLAKPFTLSQLVTMAKEEARLG